MEEQTETGQESQQAAYCHWHPNVETGLSCSHCGRSMCTRCMVQAAVGIRCPECGTAAKMPTFDVQPTFYAKAVGVGIGIAIGGGVLWGTFNWVIFSLHIAGSGILLSLPSLAVGYAAGELISAAVNAKRSRGLAYIAAGSVLGAFIISRMFGASPGDFFVLITLAIAVYLAVQRVK
ncbi:MAG: hypothetical protein O2913_07105 [Chloroflexi bacterium]|nr:hypothetical protein [Chloroflexota bacterium]